MRDILMLFVCCLCACLTVQESRSQAMEPVEVGIRYLKSTESLFIEVPYNLGRYRIEARDLDTPASPWLTVAADAYLNPLETNFAEVNPLIPVSGNMIFRVYHDGSDFPVFARAGQDPQIAIVFTADQKPGSLYFNQQMDLGISDPVEHETPLIIITESITAKYLVPRMTLCRDGQIIHWVTEWPSGYSRNNDTESGDRFFPEAITMCIEEHGGYIEESGFIIPLSD